MKFNYTVNSIRINSQWFDNLERKQNVYQKITYKGLNLYFQFYKFRLHNQENEHIFMTSIAMLRKVTKYSTIEIFELLKKMKNAKIIKIENVSRWEYLIDEDTGHIKDKELLWITATDTFPLSDYKQENGRYYIYIPLFLFQQYENKGLNEKYFALFCLINKWSHNTESKMWMSIEKMSTFLGFDKDYINKMIYALNRNYFLSSYRKRRTNGKGFYFEHHILDSWKHGDIEKFMESHKENMDKLIARVDNRKKNKKKIDIENEMEIIEDQEIPIHNEIKTNEDKTKVDTTKEFGQPKEEWLNSTIEHDEEFEPVPDEVDDLELSGFNSWDEYEKMFGYKE